MEAATEMRRGAPDRIADALRASDDIVLVGREGSKRDRGFYAYTSDVVFRVAPRTPAHDRTELFRLLGGIRDRIGLPNGEIYFELQYDGRSLQIPSIAYREVLGTHYEEAGFIPSGSPAPDLSKKSMLSRVSADGAFAKRQEWDVVLTSRVLLYPGVAVAEAEPRALRWDVRELERILPGSDFGAPRE